MSEIVNRSLAGNFFTRYLAATVTDVLPRKSKRLIFIGSIIGLLLGERAKDLLLLTAVNDKLKLAYSAASLLFPAVMSEKLWKMLYTKEVPGTHLFHSKKTGSIHTLLFEEVEETELWKAGFFLVKWAPDWLQYGSADLMAADIRELYMELHRHFNIPTHKVTSKSPCLSS